MTHTRTHICLIWFQGHQIWKSAPTCCRTWKVTPTRRMMLVTSNTACDHFLVDCLWYGLPQSRRRIYIVGVKHRARGLQMNPEQFLDQVHVHLGKLHLVPPDPDSWLCLLHRVWLVFRSQKFDWYFVLPVYVVLLCARILCFWMTMIQLFWQSLHGLKHWGQTLAATQGTVLLKVSHGWSCTWM